MGRWIRAERALGCGLAVATLFSSPVALAQDGTGDRAGESAGVVRVPPKLKTNAEPVYPEGRKAEGKSAVVRLELTVDVAGKVTAATVMESGGADFDQAAMDAAYRLEFEPASIGGKPVPAKIPFRFTFEAQPVATVPAPASTQPAPAPAASQPKRVVLEGVVRTPADEPLPGASIVAERVGDSTSPAPNAPAGGAAVGSAASATSVSNLEGRFAFAGLEPGRYRVRVVAEGLSPFESEEVIEPGKAISVVYRLKTSGDVIEIDVRGQRPAREVTVRVLERDEIQKMPGTNGDALRAVLNMPGVARPPGLAGFLIIRGSAPQDSQIFADGTQIPIAFHFGGGLASVVPSELLDRINFYPGNFAPEFGRATGGIVDMGIRSPKKVWSGLVQFDLIDGRVLIEGPINKKTRFAVAARRSWVDTWLVPVLTALGTGVSAAPVYYDYQAMIERDDVVKGTNARLLFFGSDDRLAITLNSPASSDPTLGGDISNTTTFFRGQLRTDTRVTENTRWVNTLAFGQNVISFGIGDVFFKLDSRPLTYRSDLRTKLSKEATLVLGADVFANWFDIRVRAPPPPIPGEAPGPFFGRQAREQESHGLVYRPALYAMLDLSPIKALHLLPGLRLDWTRDTDSWGLQPRFAGRYDLFSGYPRTTLKGGAGVYDQPPQAQESIPPNGTPGLRNIRATHYALGFEQEFTRNLELSLEGFYKDLTRVVVPQPAETQRIGGLLYGNTGSGRVYGMELLLRFRNHSRLFGWVAYTLSSSERRDSYDKPLRSFQFDQTHILTMLASYKLGGGWQVGARFRLVSGNMYTPARGAYFDADAGSFASISAIPPFGSRLPPFHQLDLRVDKTWQFKGWSLLAYADVLNVYNNQNPEGVSYNYNYSQETIASGVPILPTLGIRAEL